MTSIKDRGLQRILPRVIEDEKITKNEVEELISSAKDGIGSYFRPSPDETRDLMRVLREHPDKFDPEAKEALEAFVGNSAHFRWEFENEGLRGALGGLMQDGKLDQAEFGTLVEAMKSGGQLDATARKELNRVYRDFGEAFDAGAQAEMKALLWKSDGVSAVDKLEDVTDAFKAELSARGNEIQNPELAMSLFAEYAGKLKALGQGADPRAVDAEAEKLLEAGRNSPARGYDEVDTDLDRVSDLAEVAQGRDPAKFDKIEMAADHKVWTTTYWPMAGSGDMDQAGNAGTNLWAKDGPLAKMDKLLEARGMSDKAKALEFERKPALNWLVGDSNKGQFIPNSGLKESDAEYTTGVDFDGDGKITKGVKADFLDARGNFAPAYSRSSFAPKLKEGEQVINLTRRAVQDDSDDTNWEYFRPDGTKLTADEAKEVFYTHARGDGKVDGTMSVGWWGSCDKVALAGILFKEPKKDSVEMDGVTFTKQDMKGLLTVVADSQARGTDFVGARYDERPDIITLKNGSTVNGKIQDDIQFRTSDMVRRSGDYMTINDVNQPVTIKLPDGTTKTYQADEISSLAREDAADMSAADFHKTMHKWLGEDKRPAAMDKDSGDHVWNYNFWKADVNNARELKGDARPSEPGFNGPIDPKNTVTEYEMEVFFGPSETSGTDYKYWLETDNNGKVVNSGWKSANPDFMWRPSSFNNWEGYNSRNPYVDPRIVKEIYDKFQEE